MLDGPQTQIGAARIERDHELDRLLVRQVLHPLQVDEEARPGEVLPLDVEAGEDLAHVGRPDHVRPHRAQNDVPEVEQVVGQHGLQPLLPLAEALAALLLSDV